MNKSKQLDRIIWHKYPDKVPKAGTYLVTYLIRMQNGQMAGVVTMATMCIRFDGYMYWKHLSGFSILDQVIAWAEKPEPFKM